jgi:hypothetical protein
VFYGVVEQHAEAFFEVAKASKMVRYRGSCVRSSKRRCEGAHTGMVTFI